MAINLIKINEFPESVDTRNWMVVADTNGISYKISIDNVKAELGIGALMQYRGSVVPSSPVQPAGDFFVTATEAGTYTNYDGVVVPANSFAVISRVGGTWTSSITGLNTNAVLKTDIVNNLVDGGSEKVLSAEMGKLINNLITSTEEGTFTIEDESGIVSFRIYSDGSVDIPKLNLNHKINNLKIGIIGDSISTTNGGGTAGLVGNEQYYGLLNTRNGCEIFVNAVAGSSIAIGGQASTLDFCVDSRWQSLNSVFTPDVVLIFGGINDFLQDFTLGELGSTDNTVFYGALDYLYKNIMNRMPTARVFHMTPLHTKHTQGGGLVPEFNGQNYLSDFINAIYQVSRRYGVGVIDTNRNSGITCYNIADYAADLIHVDKYGHELIYNTIINETNLKL